MCCHLLFFGFPVLGLSLFWLFPFWLALSLYVPLSALAVAAGIATVRAMRNPLSTGSVAMRGRLGRVEAVEGRRLVVRIDNELWKAASREALVPGESVIIVGVDGLTLTVRPVMAAPRARARPSDSRLFNGSRWVGSPSTRILRRVTMAKDPVCGMNVEEGKAAAEAVL